MAEVDISQTHCSKHFLHTLAPTQLDCRVYNNRLTMKDANPVSLPYLCVGPTSVRMRGRKRRILRPEGGGHTLVVIVTVVTIPIAAYLYVQIYA